MSKLFIDNCAYDCPDTVSALDWEQFMWLVRFGRSMPRNRTRIARRILERIVGVETRIATKIRPEESVLFAECFASRILGGRGMQGKSTGSERKNRATGQDGVKEKERTVGLQQGKTPEGDRKPVGTGKWRNDGRSGTTGEQTGGKTGSTAERGKDRVNGKSTGTVRENISEAERKEASGTGKQKGIGRAGKPGTNGDRINTTGRQAATKNGGREGEGGERNENRVNGKPVAKGPTVGRKEQRSEPEKARSGRRQGKRNGGKTKRARAEETGIRGTMECKRAFVWAGERLFFPKEARGFEGKTIPMACLSAEEFCEATDLYIEDKWSYAPLIVAALCRPEGERYDERKACARAGRMRKIPMGIVLRLYAMLERTHREMKEKYPRCYASASGGGQGGDGRGEAARWTDMMMWTGNHIPGEVDRTKRMNAYDFVALAHSKIKMRA